MSYEPYQPPPPPHLNPALQTVDLHVRDCLQCSSWVASAQHVFAAASRTQAQVRICLAWRHTAVARIQQCTREWLVRTRGQCGYDYEPYRPHPPPQLNSALQPASPTPPPYLSRAPVPLVSVDQLMGARTAARACAHGCVDSARPPGCVCVHVACDTGTHASSWLADADAHANECRSNTASPIPMAIDGA